MPRKTKRPSKLADFPLHFMLPGEDAIKLDAKAAAARITRSEAARLAIAKYVSK